MMERITSPAGVTVSWDRYGSGPHLVLVHGSFTRPTEGRIQSSWVDELTLPKKSEKPVAKEELSLMRS